MKGESYQATLYQSKQGVPRNVNIALGWPRTIFYRYHPRAGENYINIFWQSLVEAMTRTFRLSADSEKLRLPGRQRAVARSFDSS